MNLTIHPLVESLGANQAIKDRTDAYERSVIQKVWSMDQYLNQAVTDLQPATLLTVSGTATTSQNLFVGLQQGGSLSSEDFSLRMNMTFDGLVTNAESALDSLAHIIHILYPPSQAQQDIYFNRGLAAYLMAEYSSKSITTVCNTLISDPRLSELDDYRNVTTHEQVVEPRIGTLTDPNRGTQIHRMFLPDNPRNFPFAYNQQKEIGTECSKIQTIVKETVTQTTQAIVTDLNTARSVPVPRG